MSDFLHCNKNEICVLPESKEGLKLSVNTDFLRLKGNMSNECCVCIELSVLTALNDRTMCCCFQPYLLLYRVQSCRVKRSNIQSKTPDMMLSQTTVNHRLREK